MICCHESNSDAKACSLTATGFFFLHWYSYRIIAIRAATGPLWVSNAACHFAQQKLVCTMQSAQFLTFQAISIFSQIRLDGSNYHIFPPCFTQMKWKIDGSSAHKHERTLQFFTFFPAIYSTYNGSERKNRAGFSHVCVWIKSNEFSPSNICLYKIAAALRDSGQAWRLESDVDIYYLR